MRFGFEFSHTYGVPELRISDGEIPYTEESLTVESGDLPLGPGSIGKRPHPAPDSALDDAGRE